jgi:hypothetical protein
MKREFLARAGRESGNLTNDDQDEDSAHDVDRRRGLRGKVGAGERDHPTVSDQIILTFYPRPTDRGSTYPDSPLTASDMSWAG